MIAIAEWRPDAPALAQFAREALNVIPRAMSYGPVGALAETGSALTARCQGAFAAMDINGDVHNFAGDATKLYKYNTSTAVWNDVTRAVGGAYATASAGRWTFSLFGSTVIAVNGVDNPQYYTIGTSSAFALLAGSPPVAEITATVGDFSFLGAISGAGNRIKWSGINDYDDWTIAAATQSDQQDLPSGGKVMGIVGTETGGLIFQERGVRQITYVGPPVIFQINVISENTGTPAAGSIASNGDDVFYLGNRGFMQITGGRAGAIGDEKIDRYFFERLDFANRHRVTSCIDFENSLYVVGWPDTGDAATPGNIFFYHWPSGRWSRAEVTHDMLYNGASGAAVTVEGWDALFANLDAMNISIDDPSLAAAAKYVPAAFTTAKKYATFGGANLAATIETQEAAILGESRARLISVRPMVDGGSPTVSVGVRDTQQGSVSYGNDVSITAFGACPQRATGRYIRGRIKIPAASTWTHAIGLDDIKANTVGMR